MAEEEEEEESLEEELKLITLMAQFIMSWGIDIDYSIAYYLRSATSDDNLNSHQAFVCCTS